MTRVKTGFIASALALAVAACGVTYTSPSVDQVAGGAEVRVVPLTGQSVLMANRAPYTPRSLPSVFFQATGGGSLRGAGALPQPPEFPEERPEALELRIPPAVTPQPYTIGVGDVVLLATRGGASTVEQLSGLLAAQNQRQGYTVRDDGAIAIPDVGTVQLAGMTLEEAEARLFQVLVANQIDPAFSLEIAEFNSKRVAVGGSVSDPTLVPITLNTLNLGEALTAAGGVRVQNEVFASIRLYRGGTLYQIPIKTFFARPELQGLTLVNGDAIYVDTSYDLDRALAFYRQELDVISLRRTARAAALGELTTEINLRRAGLEEQRENFAARVNFGAEPRDYVYLAGEVSRQSRYTMPYNQQTTLADVLYDSGGFDTTTGDPSQIYVLRASGNPADFGAVTAWHLNTANAANITLATRMEMRPNDVVFIEEQPITKWNRALQQVFPTLLNSAARVATN